MSDFSGMPIVLTAGEGNTATIREAIQRIVEQSSVLSETVMPTLADVIDTAPSLIFEDEMRRERKLPIDLFTDTLSPDGRTKVIRAINLAKEEMRRKYAASK